MRAEANLETTCRVALTALACLALQQGLEAGFRKRLQLALTRDLRIHSNKAVIVLLRHC